MTNFKTPFSLATGHLGTPSFWAKMLSIGLLLGCVSCVTPRPSLLPPLVEGEGDIRLQKAHAEANQAYAHCRQLTDENSVPWHSIAAGGALFSGVVVVAGGTTAALLFMDDPLIFPVGVGVAASSTALFAMSAVSAWSIPDDFHRGRIRDASLVQARQETMRALDEREPQGLLRVKRNLYENCRVADLAASGDAGDVLLRDFSRYRREARELRRWHQELQAELALQKKNDDEKTKKQSRLFEQSERQRKEMEAQIKELQGIENSQEIPSLTTSEDKKRSSQEGENSNAKKTKK